MAQYYTDFSEYTVGAEPADWTKEAGSGSASVTSYSGAPGGVALSCSGRVVYSWDGKSGSDIEVVGLIAPRGFVTYPKLMARGQSTSGYSGYVCYQPYFGGVAVSRSESGGFYSTSESSGNSKPSPFWLRFRVNGNSLKAKVWGESESEPTTWEVESTDATHASGFAGVYPRYGENDFLCFGVGTNGDTAPTEPVSSFTLVDSFEDGDYSRYSTTANILSEGASANAIDGSNTITVSNTSAYAFAYEFAVDTAAGVGPGSRIRYCQTAVNGNSYSSGFMYGSPSLGSGYAVIYRASGLDLYRFDSGAPTRLVYTDISASGPAYMEVDFGSGGTHTIKLYDDSSYTSPVHEITATDSTYSAGGVGFSSYNGVSTYGSYEIDKIEYEPLGGGGGSSPPAAPTGLTLTQL